MRFSLLLITPLLLLPIFSFSQSLVEKYPDVFEKVKEVEATDDYQIITLENEEFLEQMTDGGGTLTGYFDDDELVKMKLQLFLSYGVIKFDYYFSENDLFYVKEIFEQYAYDTETDKVNPSVMERTFSGSYVFKNGELIDYITLGHNRFEDDKLDPEQVLPQEAGEYRKLLKKVKK